MRYEPPHIGEIVDSRALLLQPRFATLWLTQGLAQTAQNAILFTLLVVVLQLTGSSAWCWRSSSPRSSWGCS